LTIIFVLVSVYAKFVIVVLVSISIHDNITGLPICYLKQIQWVFNTAARLIIMTVGRHATMSLI